MKDKNIKDIHIEIPKREYFKFKVFAAATGMTMQKLIRSAVNHYIKEAQESEKTP